jgi:hypothetical protein
MTLFSLGISRTCLPSYSPSRKSTIEYGISKISSSFPDSTTPQSQCSIRPCKPGLGSSPLKLSHYDLTLRSRLGEYKDTSSISIITLDLLTQTYRIISSSSNLPFDAFSLTPCPPSLGRGITVLSPNSIVYVDTGGSGRKLTLPLNGWAPRVMEESNLSTFVAKAKTISERFDYPLDLQGAYLVYPDGVNAGLVFGRDGYVYKLSLVVEGASVSQIKLERDAPLGKGAAPSIVETLWSPRKEKSGIGEEEISTPPTALVFVGSATGYSTLCRVSYEVIVKKVRFEDEALIANAGDGDGVVKVENGITNGVINGSGSELEVKTEKSEREAEMDLDDGMSYSFLGEDAL